MLLIFTLTGIFSTTSVSRTQHFRVNDNIDAIRSMPSFTNSAKKKQFRLFLVHSLWFNLSVRFFSRSIHLKIFIQFEIAWCEFRQRANAWAYRFSITGTSTACRVFGLRRDPGLRAPHPAAHPNLPKKSSFFSGKQIGAAHGNEMNIMKYEMAKTWTYAIYVLR